MSGRSSDRWVTPGVVCTALVVGGVLVLAVVASVTWLAAQGRDPDPMLRLVAQVVGAVGSMGTLLLQLTGRATTAKVERNTGQLTSAVVQVVDELEARAGRHAAAPLEEGVALMDPGTRPHPFLGTRTAPAVPGSVGQDTLNPGPPRGPSERRGVR